MRVDFVRRLGLGVALTGLVLVGTSPASAQEGSVPPEWWDVMVCEPVGVLPVEEPVDLVGDLVEPVAGLVEDLESFEFGELDAGMIPVLETDGEVCYMPVLGAPTEDLPTEDLPVEEVPVEEVPAEEVPLNPEPVDEVLPGHEAESEQPTIEETVSEQQPPVAVESIPLPPEVLEMAGPSEATLFDNEVVTAQPKTPVVLGQSFELPAQPMVVQKALTIKDFSSVEVGSPIRVAAPTAAVATGILPNTGGPSARLAWLALPLLAAGATLVARGRRQAA